MRKISGKKFLEVFTLEARFTLNRHNNDKFSGGDKLSQNMKLCAQCRRIRYQIGTGRDCLGFHFTLEISHFRLEKKILETSNFRGSFKEMNSHFMDSNLSKSIHRFAYISRYPVYSLILKQESTETEIPPALCFTSSRECVILTRPTYLLS